MTIGMYEPHNPLHAVDSYKLSHFLQYPPHTKRVYSYLESRGGKWPRTVFFGLQPILKTYFQFRVTEQMVRKRAARAEKHGVPFPEAGWLRIVNKHDGYMPLSIQAVPEGSVIPVHNALMTIENTDPELPWLTTWIETLTQRIWYPITVATLSWHAKQIIKQELLRTSDVPIDLILPSRLHDFGARGTSSGESAAIGGSAHLVNFAGTDNMEALDYVAEFYGEDMAGFSIPASEHSTMTAWGRSGETDAYRNMVEKFSKPGSYYATVSDSYNLWTAINDIWGGTLRDAVLGGGGTLVIRPDSGHPPTVVVKALGMMSERFGFTENSKGFKVINSAVRLIQGDGVSIESIPEILSAVAHAGFSTENLALGMGGGLLQKMDRDTQKFAIKASAVDINGTWRGIGKDPITDHGKRSKMGRLALIREHDKYETVGEDDNHWRNMMRPVYRNGQILKEYSFTEVREQANREAMD